MMQDVTTAWDLSSVRPEPSGPTRVYIFFLLAVFIVAAKLIGAWKLPANFNSAERSTKPLYIQKLFTNITSLSRWIWLTLLSWGICFLLNMNILFNRIRFDHDALRPPASLLPILSVYLFFSTMPLFTATFLYLVRWN